MSFEKELKEKGLKNTKSRNAIMEIFLSSETPISAEDVYKRLRESGNSINLSTVYRSLEILEEKDILNRINMDSESCMLFEYKNPNHKMEHSHYLVCTECKKMVALDHCPLKEYEERLEEQTGFSIESHSLHLYGRCKECRANGEHDGE